VALETPKYLVLKIIEDDGNVFPDILMLVLAWTMAVYATVWTWVVASKLTVAIFYKTGFKLQFNDVIFCTFYIPTLYKLCRFSVVECNAIYE
jgi:hypothetical protein